MMRKASSNLKRAYNKGKSKMGNNRSGSKTYEGGNYSKSASRKANKGGGYGGRGGSYGGKQAGTHDKTKSHGATYGGEGKKSGKSSSSMGGKRSHTSRQGKHNYNRSGMRGGGRY